jgi:hypothetical protein
MYTLAEAKLSRHNPTYHIPTGVMRDCDREGVIRALEQEDQLKDKPTGWLLSVKSSSHQLFTTIFGGPKSGTTTITAEPETTG